MVSKKRGRPKRKRPVRRQYRASLAAFERKIDDSVMTVQAQIGLPAAKFNMTLFRG